LTAALILKGDKKMKENKERYIEELMRKLPEVENIYMRFVVCDIAVRLARNEIKLNQAKGLIEELQIM